MFCTILIYYKYQQGKGAFLFDVLDTAGMDARRAIASNISDYEDAVMIETAIRGKADCIVTRNIKEYSISPVPVYSPAEFLKLLKGNLN